MSRSAGVCASLGVLGGAVYGAMSIAPAMMRCHAPGCAAALILLSLTYLGGVGGLVGIALGWPAGWLLGMLRRHREVLGSRVVGLAALSFVALALLLHRMDLTLYVRLYPAHHALLGLASLSSLVFAALLWAPIALERRLAAAGRWAAIAPFALILMGFASTGPLLSWSPSGRTASFWHAAGLSHALYAATRLGDRDGDGFPGIFGCGDCDDHDQAIHPGRTDYPGDGIDSDCTGRDAARLYRVPAQRSSLSGTLAGSRPNVLVVTYEAFRYDRVPWAGESRDLVPNFSALAARGVSFTRAYAAGCWTFPAVWALFTGVYPTRISWVPIAVDDRDRVLEPADPEHPEEWVKRFPRGTYPSPKHDHHPTLFDALHDHGYTTMTAASFLLFRRGGGITDRFDVVDGSPQKEAEAAGDPVTSIRVTRAAIRMLDEHRGGPFFMWLHYYDTHEPYVRTPGEPDFGPGPVDRYDSELWRMDRAFGALLAWMDQAGLLEDTLILVLGDHGEEFGDHGAMFHGSSVYDEQVRVPMALVWPGGPAGVVVDGPVSTVDLAPTILDLLGIGPPGPMDGRSLLPTLSGQATAARPILLTCSRFEVCTQGLVVWPFKLVLDRVYGTRELYDLANDPAERVDLAGSKPHQLQTLERRLLDLLDGGQLAPGGATGP